MKTLIVSDSKCDFVDVLESCGAETECIEFQKVLTLSLIHISEPTRRS